MTRVTAGLLVAVCPKLNQPATAAWHNGISATCDVASRGKRWG